MYKLVSFSKDHIEEVISLANNCFGSHYLNTACLNDYLKMPEQNGLVLLDSNKIIGFSFYKFITRNEIFRHFHIELSSVLSEYFAEYSSICYRQQTAIANGYRNKGVSEMLIRQGIEAAAHRKAGQISIVWNHNNAAMEKILLKFGFEMLAKHDDYWYNDSLEKKYSCVVCGQPPCRCSATVMVKKSVY